MIMDPLFSILIANYNNGRYLQEAIDSVLTQTYTSWQIILVDDGSTDNSFEIYEKYKNDSRFHIYYNEENKGCGYTKHRCVDLADTELCGFLDPDDKIHAITLERMVPECEKRPDCAVVYSSTYQWDDATGDVKVIERVGAIDDDEDYLISLKKSAFHFAVIRKSFYNKTVGIDENLRTGVDYDLYLKLEEVGKLHYVDIPLYYYRQNNPNSISGISKKNNKTQLAITHWEIALNAQIRRIASKNFLYVNNKPRYKNQMRWLLGRYKRLEGKVTRRMVKYFYWYLKANGFSLKSFNHLRKIILTR